ncbi:MAG: hypothetical protein ACYTAS_09150 [Planctomycetota bacterium]|jgi:hypothetical protein
MSPAQRTFGLVFVLVLLVLGQGTGSALTREEAVDLIATRLDESQTKDGPHRGLWSPEVVFMGSITTGMASAFEWTGEEGYKTSADFAGHYILRVSVAQGNLFGDEAYAFVYLSEMSEDPHTNVWQNALEDFYLSPRKGHGKGAEQTTREYLSAFDGVEPSTATFYMAHHVMAAYYVEDQDAKVWREALIRHLSRVDDEATFPVMALGVATWALAATGPLDETPVSLFYEAVPYWEGVTLADLPELLAGYQVPHGEPFSGSFYWRFDQGSGGTGGAVAGYTEDAIFGTLGLIAAASLETEEPDEALQLGITAAETVLLGGIDEDGGVYEHLSRQGNTYDAFAGEMLHALWSIEQYWREQAVAVDGTEPPLEDE